MAVYPVFLNNLSEQRTLIFGGNDEAERKAGELLEVGANVTLFTPDPTETLRRYAEQGRLEWVDRWYEPGDLEGAFMVIVSELDPEATDPIWEEADERNVLFCAMDDIPHCNFFNGSVVRRGPLVIAISTTGAAPTVSVRIRERLEEEFGPEYAHYLELMEALRDPMARQHPDFDERLELWYELVDSPLLALIEDERYDLARSLVGEIAGEEVSAQVNGTLPRSKARRVAHEENDEAGWFRRLLDRIMN